MTAGKVYLVGAGPGAPDLLTLRAAQILRRADVIFHDALVHPDTLALGACAERISVGKRCGRHSTAQRFINKRLVDAARKYACVVRLKGGDPMLFGRAQEEIEALRDEQIEFEVVPGVTAALAASAELGVSLTQRGAARSVAFVTPRVGAGTEANRWAQVAASADTTAIYMGAGESEAVAEALVQRGVRSDMPVCVIENVSLPERKAFRLTLADLPRIAGVGLTGPALILLGKVYQEAGVSGLTAFPKVRSA